MSSQITVTGGHTHPDGIQIGAADTEKIGFYGTAPISQPAVDKVAGSDPSKAEFDKLVDALIALGLVKEDD